MPFTLIISTHDEDLYQMIKAMASASGKASVCRHPAFDNPGFNVNPQRPECPIQGQLCMPAKWAQEKFDAKDTKIKKLEAVKPEKYKSPECTILAFPCKQPSVPLGPISATATSLAIREYMVSYPSVDQITFTVTRKAPRKYTTTVAIVP